MKSMLRREHIRYAVMFLGAVFLSGIAPAILLHSLAVHAEPSPGVDLSWIKDISVTGALCFLGFLTYKLVDRGIAAWAAKKGDDSERPSARGSDFAMIADGLARIERLLERQADELNGLNKQLAVFNERFSSRIIDART